jgi:hypothetical protein
MEISISFGDKVGYKSFIEHNLVIEYWFSANQHQ